MRRALIVLAVLGSGTALTFLTAGAIFLAAPDGHLVANGGGASVQRGPAVIVQPVPGKVVPMPLPVVVDDTGTVGNPGLSIADGQGAVAGPLVSSVNVSVGVALPPQSGTQP